MRKLSVFNQVTLDGFFTDKDNDLSWAHEPDDDAEYNSFVEGNASNTTTTLVFGRTTYEMMASFWPTPEAAKQFPEVAKGMNAAPKIVFSKSLDKVDWANTRIERDLSRMREIKAEQGTSLLIMGSGSLVSQLTQLALIDEYQLVVFPLVLGEGRSMFDGVDKRANLKLTKSRGFKNGKVYLVYDRR
jgi:dihydrofolate reductase